ncbi:MAG: hypothetical protein EAX96_13885 [Candidatus Lokiarchaeota archaeon]|nr:hypothetical protein [Candidatus Lokiarchaeota archaeon]
MAVESPLTFKDLLKLDITDEIILDKIQVDFEKRYEKALQAINEERVHKYIFEPSNRIVWIVTGTERDYWIIPDIYCNCNDFYINVISKNKYDACYHLLAKVLSEKLGNKYKVWKLKDDRYINLMNEWKSL